MFTFTNIIDDNIYAVRSNFFYYRAGIGSEMIGDIVEFLKEVYRCQMQRIDGDSYLIPCHAIHMGISYLTHLQDKNAFNDSSTL